MKNETKTKKASRTATQNYETALRAAAGPAPAAKVSKAPAVATVQSQTDGRRYYTIRKSAKGRVTCDCPSFHFSHLGRCKHTDVYLGVVEEGIENPAVTLAA